MHKSFELLTKGERMMVEGKKDEKTRQRKENGKMEQENARQAFLNLYKGKIERNIFLSHHFFFFVFLLKQ